MSYIYDEHPRVYVSVEVMVALPTNDKTTFVHAFASVDFSFINPGGIHDRAKKYGKKFGNTWNFEKHGSDKKNEENAIARLQHAINFNEDNVDLTILLAPEYKDKDLKTSSRKPLQFYDKTNMPEQFRSKTDKEKCK